MKSDLASYRSSARERARIDDLLGLCPDRGESALDIGARDAYISRLLAHRFDRVVALDLEKPSVEYPRVEAIQGDASRLQFADATFDLVLCAEVLEHMPASVMESACREIARVTAKTAIIGVPYRQDLRVGRTICLKCGHRNPPWGHVNSFDEQGLRRLFPEMRAASVHFVGKSDASTNCIASALMDYAGNPYGTYEQEEPCTRCGNQLMGPAGRTLVQKLATKAAHGLNLFQYAVSARRAGWMHIRFEKIIG